MRRITSLVWVDATSGVPLIFGIPLVSINVFLLMTVAAGSLHRGWGDPLNLFLTVSMYGGALAMGAGAAHAASVTRKGLPDWAVTTGRSWWAPHSIAASSSVLWAVLAQLLGLLVVTIRGTPGDSSPWVWMLGVQAVLLPPAFALLGSVVGARLTAAPVAALLALGAFAWCYGWSYASGPTRKLSPVYPEVFYSQPIIEPQHVLVLSQSTLLFAMIVSSVAVLAPFARRKFITVAVAIAVAGALGLVHAGNEPTQYPSHVQPLCRVQGGVSLCVYPQYSPSLEMDLDTLVSLKKVVSPYLVTPSFYQQDGLAAVGDGHSYFGMYATSENDRRDRAIEAILPVERCPGKPGSSDAIVDLIEWVRYRSGHPDPYAELPDFESWSSGRTQSWVSARVAILTAPC